MIKSIHIVEDFINKNSFCPLKKNIILFGIITIPFLLITIGRFNESPLGVYWEIINYMGQQLPNFNDHYIVNAPLQYGDLNFPVVMDIMRSLSFNLGIVMDKEQYFSYFFEQGVFPWVFTTFIGGLMLDFGKTGTLIMLIILFFLTRNLIVKCKQKNSLLFSNYILFILYFQITYLGVFYFRLFSANYYIIAMILLHLIFKLLKGKNIVMTKIN